VPVLGIETINTGSLIWVFLNLKNKRWSIERKKLFAINRKEKNGTINKTIRTLLKYGNLMFLGFRENSSVNNFRAITSIFYQ
tara:strand:- start:195 stop:440 length:246 start_codon:yes stop_codon:yes gene_type:complete